MKVSKFFISASVVFISMSALAFADITHKVESGDTYYSIARKYGVKVSEIYSANGLTENDTLKIGQALKIPGIDKAEKKAESNSSVAYDTYVVQKDDTFYRIAKNNSITVDELLEINGFTKNEVLKVGKKIKIPHKGVASSTEGSKTESKTVETNSADTKVEARKFDTYTVQKGDTFYHIAKVNAITVDELKTLNGLDSKSELKAGQKLKIPVTIVDTANANLPSLPDDPRKYSAKKGDPNLSWPVKNPTITYMTGKISGVQLGCAKNENVTAIRAGTVMYVGNYRGYGQVVFVQTKTGHIYVYSGLGSIKVKKGDYLVFGDVIGTAGTDSIKGTNQMCLMVFQKSSPIDPAKAPRG
ncbi:LysM peptidoglycan-binding domain-containing protein [Treponema sp.]|uniref:LysM peptidoglycan-binding domain-containing protein n=1 Tax=Treponema sp. TaxID=166 RepID=UPI00298E5CDB|nr:LysM peptidoglycan-binding domain-containing protein [Treponema sp.]MCQ2240319.1 LysM peptidoglycan-binding domain-containing protein [Treponema sp.]